MASTSKPLPLNRKVIARKHGRHTAHGKAPGPLCKSFMDKLRLVVTICHRSSPPALFGVSLPGQKSKYPAGTMRPGGTSDRV
jgi:hypothetical protein